MLIHVNDAVTLQGARALRQPLIIPYGIHQEYELQLVTGHDNRPVDIESHGCVKWTLTVTPSPENPTKVLAYAVFPENIATGNCIRFDLAATSVEMYKHVAGNPATPAILQLQGFTGEDAPATTVVVLPVTLTTTAQQRRPVDLSTALMQELQLAVSTAGAAQRAIYSQQISTGEDADRAEHAAAMAQASEANAQQSSEEAAAASADARTAADDAEDYAKAAKSWAVGDTGTRQDEDTDNSMYYSRQAAESENGARLAAQAAELARDAAVDAKLLAESAQAAAEAAASGAADATADAIEAQFRDDITATGAAVTAAQTAASNALSAQQAAAASALSAQQSAYDAYDYAQRAMTNLPLILQAPPTTETPSILGKLGLWHDEAHDVNHLYHLAYITTSGNLTAYHWEECLLLSSLNQAGSLVTTDANGKIPSGVLPVSGDGVLGAVSVLAVRRPGRGVRHRGGHSRQAAAVQAHHAGHAGLRCGAGAGRGQPHGADRGAAGSGALGARHRLHGAGPADRKRGAHRVHGGRVRPAVQGHGHGQDIPLRRFGNAGRGYDDHMAGAGAVLAEGGGQRCRHARKRRQGPGRAAAHDTHPAFPAVRRRHAPHCHRRGEGYLERQVRFLRRLQ